MVMTGLQHEDLQLGHCPDSEEYESMESTPSDQQLKGKLSNIPTVLVEAEPDPQPQYSRELEKQLQRTPSFGKSVKFLLPPITIEDNAVEDVLGCKIFNFKQLFFSDEWTDITDPLSSEEEEEICEHRIKCLNNLAATQLKLHHFDDVLNSCNAVLEMDQDNAKALHRKGKMLSDRGQYEEAMPILKQALQLEPTTKAIHAELSKLVRRQRGQPEVNKSPIRAKSNAHLKLREYLNPLIHHSTKKSFSHQMLIICAFVAAVLSFVTRNKDTGTQGLLAGKPLL
ncbi:hypothetical protein XELAEV_18020553mg [Xenopus laevis]|uniref:Uncharacterized protein n=1 Tax=Xenopus laevis TaxID=8355 RepID=A0A974D811_XENLA|nr:hypothetical protein XELAEV_18020553mg [Xenopus laevis]